MSVMVTDIIMLKNNCFFFQCGKKVISITRSIDMTYIMYFVVVINIICYYML